MVRNTDPEPEGRGRFTADARILRADNGSEITFEKFARSGERPMVWSLDARGRMLARPVRDVRLLDPQQAFTVRLGSGRQMEATASTEFLTLRGWTPLIKLQVGERVGCPRRVPDPLDARRMADDEVVLLAHMIGDGSCVKRQPIRYASIDEMSLTTVANAAKHFGVIAKRDDYPEARVTTLRLPAPYRLARGKRNPIAAWLDGLGLFGLRSHEKFVPKEVFATSNDQVALFLRHLWATDGCIAWDAKLSIGRVYYASTSQQLIEDVRQLLLRFGIASRAYPNQKGSYRVCWQLAISGASNQRRFLRDIDVHGVKFFAAREVLTKLASVQSNENVDTVPREVWDQVRRDLAEQGMSHRAFAAAMQTKFCGSAMWKPSPSRGRLHRAAAILNDRGLHDLTNNDVFWDKIAEIKSLGERDTYSIAVEDTQNLVVQGVSVSAGRLGGQSGIADASCSGPMKMRYRAGSSAERRR